MSPPEPPPRLRHRLVVALAADHGVMPLPEHERLRGRDARREDARDVACIQGVYGELRAELGDRPWLEAPGYLSRKAVFRSGRSRTEIEDRARELLEACPTVERVWTRGGIDKLEISRRLGVGEVWTWKDDRLEVHALEGDRFEQAERSRLFPDLDLDLLVSLLDRPTALQAVRALRQALSG